MSTHLFSTVPSAQGLYDPAQEKDSCGVAMLATLNKKATHDIVSQALTALRNLEHRGASGAEPDSGDGAGILIRIPDEFYREVLSFDLPARGKYASGIAFISESFADMDALASIADEENLQILGWRDLPTNSTTLGETALSVMPKFVQLFIAGKNGEEDLSLDRMAFCSANALNMHIQFTFHRCRAGRLSIKACSQPGNLKNSFPIYPIPECSHH